MSMPSLSRLVGALLLAVPLAASAGPKAGEPDPTFGDGDPARPGTVVRGFNNGYKDDGANALVQDAEGNLTAIGLGSTSDGDRCIGLMRFSADGVLDQTGFGFDQNNVAQGKICHRGIPEPGWAPEFIASDAVVQPNGSVVISGLAFPPAEPPRGFICRFLFDGSIDTGFSPDGTPGCLVENEPSYYFPRLVVDGSRLLVISHNTDVTQQAYELRLHRYSLDDGSIQPFGQEQSVKLLSGDPNVTYHVATDAVMTSSGHVVMAIQSKELETFVLGMLDPNSGNPVAGFNGTGTLSIPIDAATGGIEVAVFLKALPDNKLLVGGLFEQMDDLSGIALVQLSSETGAPDPSFNEGSPLLYSPCATLGGCDLWSLNAERAANGNIVLGGIVEAAGLPERIIAMKIRPDGSPDTSFGNPSGLRVIESDVSMSDMLLQDERVVFGGRAMSVDTVYVDGDDEDQIPDQFQQIVHDDFMLLRLGDGRVFNDGFEDKEP